MTLFTIRNVTSHTEDRPRDLVYVDCLLENIQAVNYAETSVE